MAKAKQITATAGCREENRIASGWLLHYSDRLAYHAIRRQESEDATASALGGDGQPRGSGVSNPTANRALELATEDMEKTEAWFELVREVEDEIEEPVLLIWLMVRRRYRDRSGRRGWLPKAQREFAEEVAAALGAIEDDTYKSAGMLRTYWDALVDFAVRKAIRRGLLPIKSKEE